jgi:hypothetical protein
MTPKLTTIADLISRVVRPEERQRRKEKVKTLPGRCTTGRRR